MNIRNMALGAVGLLAVIALGFALWFFRPWAPYSPAGVWEGRNAEDRAEYYRTMDEVFPHRKIAASPQPVSLPRVIEPLEIAYVHEGAQRTLADYAQTYDITGLMVVKNGAVVFEEYWQGESPDDLHTSWSVAKSVVGILIGMAISDGMIDSLDDPAEKYAPIYRGTDFGETSIRHLLMMSSGIDFKEDYEIVGSDMRKLFFNVFFLNKDVDKFVRVYERDQEPGTEFVYQSPNTIVLAAVLRGAYGENLSSIAEAKMFAPLGLGNGTWLLDRNAKNGKELGYCCLNIRLEDYAKIGIFLLDDGVVNGRSLLPEGWVDFVSTPPQDSHVPDAATNTKGYGHHFWVPADREETFFLAGYNGQNVWVDRKNGVVAAMTGADRAYPGQTEYAEMIEAALDAAAGL